MVAATVGYLLGVVGPIIASIVAITVWIEDACEPDAFECYAPLAYLLVIPVALLGIAVTGPLGCAIALGSRGHQRAGATGWRCAALALVFPVMFMVLSVVGSAVPAAAVSGGLLVGTGLVPFGLMFAVPVIARAWATSGQPPPGAAWEQPRGTTWDSQPIPGIHDHRPPSAHP